MLPASAAAHSLIAMAGGSSNGEVATLFLLAPVVGGHMLGAWGGHVVAAAEAPPGLDAAGLRLRQLPLAVVMVGLTTLTLWSLGQSIVITPQ